MPDPLLRDSRLAAYLFLLGSLILLPAALMGLESWPGQEIIQALVSAHPQRILAILGSSGYVLAAIFWASHPGRRSRWSVVLAWGVLTLLAWIGLGDALNLGLSGSRGFPVDLFLLATMAPACLLALGWRVSRNVSGGADHAYEMRLRWLVILALLFLLQPAAGLQLTALHPRTFDLVALRFDHLAGLNWTPWLTKWIDEVPGLSRLIHLAYGWTPLGFLAVALLQLKGRPGHVASALLVWVGMTSLALLAYHAFPITGPRYVFGAAAFLERLRNPEALPVTLSLVSPYPRNGMPSMHFGWMLAASIMWWQCGTRPWTRALIIAATLCTALATLYTGEHYTIDLVVAVPFVLASLALCSTGVSWSSRARREAVWLGFAAWLAWVVLLRGQIDLFVAHPWAAKLLVFLTLAVAARQAQLLSRFAGAVAAVDAARVAPAAGDRVLARKFALMFFASGAAALVYQVLFAKELALVFGSTATATFTVLATFLGGMAIGSFAGGVIAHRVARPVLVYAVIEAAIGVYCIATPSLFIGMQGVYVALAAGAAPDAAYLIVLRVLLGALVLLVPTVLMGATLPLLAAALGRQGGSMGVRVAWLYLANTAGAAVGALLTAYFVIPALGVKGTTLIAALINLLVALGAVAIFKSQGATHAAHSSAADAAAAPAPRRAPRVAALLALGVGGVLSLGLEVVYVHMLSIVAGNSVYAFGLMVATFLVGLSLGGEGGRRVLLRGRIDSALALTVALLGLSACVSITALLWNGIPEYFASFANYPVAKTFGEREMIRAIVCALVMIPPTLFIGAAYTFAMDMVTASGGLPQTILLGIGGMVNTLGNIVGVLLFGFVLLPALGGMEAGKTIARAALALALLVPLVAARRHLRLGLLLGMPVLALAVLVARHELDYDNLSSGANVYFYPQHWGKVVDHAESIDGGLTAVSERRVGQQSVRTLLTNGKFQGNDSPQGEMQAQIGFAVAPLLHTDRRERALVIGYGTGVTSRVLHEAGFRHLEIAELSADIVTMADRHFGAINRQVSGAPGVALHVTDGRNLLLLGDSRYDLISIEITSIWFAGAASLYNREFYRLAKRRLAADGVLQQWLQLHRLDPADILSVIATVRTEFRHVSLYVIGQQGILVATDAPEHRMPTAKAIDTLHRQEGLAEVRRIAGGDFAAIAGDLLLTPEALDRFIDHHGFDPAWLASTDNNLRLEYSTPRANVNDPEKSYVRNVEMLRGFAGAEGVAAPSAAAPD